MERAPPTVAQTRPPFPLLLLLLLLRPFHHGNATSSHRKLSDYVAKNGVEFEEMMRQKQMEMFWWLEDKSSREYGMYKRLLESKIGIPNANACSWNTNDHDHFYYESRTPTPTTKKRITTQTTSKRRLKRRK